MAATASEPLTALEYWGAISGGASLLVLGAAAAKEPFIAAEAYGIPLADKPSDMYIVAAGVRDLFAGSAILAFALMRDRRALGTVVALTSMIATGDAILAARHSPRPAKVLPTHLAGLAACVGGSILLLRRL